MRDKTNPAVLFPPEYPRFFDLLANTSPTIEVGNEMMKDIAKKNPNKNKTQPQIPSVMLTVASLEPELYITPPPEANSLS